MPGALMPGGLMPGALMPGGLNPGALVRGALVRGALVPGGLVPGALMIDGGPAPAARLTVSARTSCRPAADRDHSPLCKAGCCASSAMGC